MTVASAQQPVLYIFIYNWFDIIILFPILALLHVSLPNLYCLEKLRLHYALFRNMDDSENVERLIYFEQYLVKLKVLKALIYDSLEIYHIG